MKQAHRSVALRAATARLIVGVFMIAEGIGGAAVIWLLFMSRAMGQFEPVSPDPPLRLDYVKYLDRPRARSHPAPGSDGSYLRRYDEAVKNNTTPSPTIKGTDDAIFKEPPVSERDVHDMILGALSLSFPVWKALGALIILRFLVAGELRKRIKRGVDQHRTEIAERVRGLERAGAPYSHIRHIAIVIAKSMNMDRHIVIHRQNSSFAELTVTVDKEVIRIVITNSAALLADLDEVAFKGMLAHELAHVANGDESAWGVSEGARSRFAAYRTYVVPAFMVLVFVTGYLFGGGSWPHLDVQVARQSILYAVGLGVPSICLTIACSGVLAFLRRQSEYAADIRAAVAVGVPAVIRALEMLTTTTPARARSGLSREMSSDAFFRELSIGLHPSKDRRLKRLAARFANTID